MSQSLNKQFDANSTGSFVALFGWRLVAREVLVVAMLWVSYLLTRFLTEDTPKIQGFATFMVWTETFMFWSAVVVSIISLLITSTKSLLPATALTVAAVVSSFVGPNVAHAGIMAALATSVLVHALWLLVGQRLAASIFR